MPAPKSVICYICGRQYMLHSYPIHVAQCRELFEKRESLKPAKERRKLPPDPYANKKPTALSLDEMNEAASSAYKESLAQCEHCGRRFLPEKLIVHQRSCTATNPAKRVGNSVSSIDKGISSSSEKLSRPGSSYGSFVEPPGPMEIAELLKCPHCQRQFNEISYDKHVKICEKVFVKKRKPFDSAKARAKDSELMNYYVQNKRQSNMSSSSVANKQSRKSSGANIRGSRSDEERSSGNSRQSSFSSSSSSTRLSSSRVNSSEGLPKWKQESLSFREAIRAARAYTQESATGTSSKSSTVLEQSSRQGLTMTGARIANSRPSRGPSRDPLRRNGERGSNRGSGSGSGGGSGGGIAMSNDSTGFANTIRHTGSSSSTPTPATAAAAAVTVSSAMNPSSSRSSKGRLLPSNQQPQNNDNMNLEMEWNGGVVPVRKSQNPSTIHDDSIKRAGNAGNGLRRDQARGVTDGKRNNLANDGEWNFDTSINYPSNDSMPKIDKQNSSQILSTPGLSSSTNHLSNLKESEATNNSRQQELSHVQNSSEIRKGRRSFAGKDFNNNIFDYSNGPSHDSSTNSCRADQSAQFAAMQNEDNYMSKPNECNRVGNRNGSTSNVNGINNQMPRTPLRRGYNNDSSGVAASLGFGGYAENELLNSGSFQSRSRGNYANNNRRDLLQGMESPRDLRGDPTLIRAGREVGSSQLEDVSSIPSKSGKISKVNNLSNYY